MKKIAYLAILMTLINSTAGYCWDWANLGLGEREPVYLTGPFRSQEESDIISTNVKTRIDATREMIKFLKENLKEEQKEARRLKEILSDFNPKRYPGGLRYHGSRNELQDLTITEEDQLDFIRTELNKSKAIIESHKKALQEENEIFKKLYLTTHYRSE